MVGGEALSKNELSVDELLLPLLWDCDCGSSLPSLLELPEESCVFLSLVNEAFERRRNWKSLRKEGIAAATTTKVFLHVQQRQYTKRTQVGVLASSAAQASSGVRSGRQWLRQWCVLASKTDNNQCWAGQPAVTCEEATDGEQVGSTQRCEVIRRAGPVCRWQWRLGGGAVAAQPSSCMQGLVILVHTGND